MITMQHEQSTGQQADHDELMSLLSQVVLGEAGRAPNGITTVVLDGDTFDRIRELADAWNEEACIGD